MRCLRSHCIHTPVWAPLAMARAYDLLFHAWNNPRNACCSVPGASFTWPREPNLPLRASWEVRCMKRQGSQGCLASPRISPRAWEHPPLLVSSCSDAAHRHPKLHLTSISRSLVKSPLAAQSLRQVIAEAVSNCLQIRVTSRATTSVSRRASSKNLFRCFLSNARAPRAALGRFWAMNQQCHHGKAQRGACVCPVASAHAAYRCARDRTVTPGVRYPRNPHAFAGGPVQPRLARNRPPISLSGPELGLTLAYCMSFTLRGDERRRAGQGGELCRRWLGRAW